MRPRFPQQPLMTVFACFSLASALCGVPPQEGRVQQPSTTQAAPAPTPRSAPTPSMGTEGRGNRAASEGRPTRSGPVQRTADQQAVRPSGGGLRASGIQLVPGTNVVVPPAWNRCTSRPTSNYWQRRDLMAEIQWMSRRGSIPVTPIGDAVDALTDYAWFPSGWRAYGISVPVGGTVQVEVQHPSLGWFRLMMVDKWGTPGPGMLRAAYIDHQPVMVTYTNPHKDATAIYIIVDDPAWWSDAKNPYNLLVRRNWDPATTDLSQVKMVVGLWGATPSVSAEFRGPSLSGPAVYPH